MARITVEDCLNKEGNRFALVQLASKRAKQLLSGKTAVVDTKGNKPIVSALREIAQGKVRFRRSPYILASSVYSENSTSDKASTNSLSPNTH